MLDLPELGQKVRVWPMPGRQVQHGPRPVDHLGGGRWMPRDGVEVVWSEFHLEQLRAGDLLLHPPPDDQAALLPAEKAPPAPEKKSPPQRGRSAASDKEPNGNGEIV